MRLPSSPHRGGVATLAAVGLSALFALAATAARADDAPAAAPKDTVRAEVGAPLQAAQGLMKDKKFKEALAKIHEAELIPNRTPYEIFVTDQMRGSAAANNGDDELAATSFEAVVNSGRQPADQRLKTEQAIAGTYFKLKNYTKAVSWASRYLKEGGTEASAEDLIINSYYLLNDFASAANELKTVVEADEKAGRVSTEVHLQILLNCYSKLNNGAAQGAVLEKLLVSYPKKDYWEIAISHVQHRASADRLTLDVLRLRFALADLKKEADYMTLSQLALDAGFPSEAKKVVEQGYAAGILGKGPEAERHKRLQALVNKMAAEDQATLAAGDADAEKLKGGDGLINAGYNYVLNGKHEKGLALMEQGMKKGGLKHPEDARLHLGIAQYLSGEKARAVQTFHAVTGNDGVGDLAHLWAVYAAR